MSRYLKMVEMTFLIALLVAAGTALSQPLNAELIYTGYGLIGDTLYGGTLILDGFVQGHEATLQIMTPTAGAEYKYYRTPYGATAPDVVTSWTGATTADIDGGGDGEIFEFTAAARLGTDSTMVCHRPVWLMHDWYRPNRVEVESYAYGDDAPIPFIDVKWSRGTDSASGVYFYMIYRALNEAELTYIDPLGGDLARDTVWESGSPGYIWRDYGVTPGVRYYYKIVPVDKAGWVRQSENNTIIGKAEPSPGEFPPCSYQEVLPRYHSGSGIMVNIDHSLCPGRSDLEYQYRKSLVTYDALGIPTIHTASSEYSSGWTLNDFYFWNTEQCSTYAFSARVRVIGGIEHAWSDLTSLRVMSTNDDIPPGCPSYFNAVSLGELGIQVDFTHDPANYCGSGTMGYYLYRVPVSDWGDVIDDATDPAIGWELALEDYLLHTYPVTPGDIHYSYGDDGPTDTLIDLIDNECYFYLVSPFDSAGNVTWVSDCDTIGGRIDTACVDKGVGAPVPVTLDFPEYVTDSIKVKFVDTTFCDAEQVVIEWAKSYDFTIGFASVGPIDILTTDEVAGVYRYENIGTPGCTDWDTLEFTLYDIDENSYWFHAKFIDGNGNHSEWSAPTLSTTVDNTPPAAVGVDYIQSIATGVDSVKIKVTWDAGGIYDAGSGVQSLKIYRSDAIGSLGSEIASLDPSADEYTDYTPDPTDNWHSNVYTVVPVDVMGHENTTGAQGYFTELSGPFGLEYHPPIPPSMVAVTVSPYLDSFTVFWEDPGHGHTMNRYTLRHSASLTGLWSPDPLLRKEVNLGSSESYQATFPIEELMGAEIHYFTVRARDTDTPNNQSGWSAIFEFELPERFYTEFTYHMAMGWNLISLPVIPDNRNASVLFPGNEGVYEWNHAAGAYDTGIDIIEPGHAYWIVLLSPADFVVSGRPVMWVETDMSESGWWTVGAPYDTLPMGYEYSEFSLLYSYDAITTDYDTVPYLESGQGYWLLAWDGGDFRSEPGMSYSKAAPGNELPDWAFSLFANGEMLQIGASANSAFGLDRMDSPKPPAVPGSDIVAFLAEGDGFTYDRSIRPDGEWTIIAPIQTELSWNPKAIPDVGLLLVTSDGIIDMRDVSGASIFGEAKVISGDALPQSFALKPVRPNPFNPTCKIPFALPEDVHVILTVFDLTGRFVTRIADADYTAGEHSVFWHGTDESGGEMPGGIYFCRMNAGSFVETRRMLLVK